MNSLVIHIAQSNAAFYEIKPLALSREYSMCYSLVMAGVVVSVNVSAVKGVRKTPVKKAVITENHGMEGDAHASGLWKRQISLLALESIDKMRGLSLSVGPGDFAENITTGGIELTKLPIGARLRMGKAIEVEVSQIGKTCHERCEIYSQAGYCVMPEEGIFVFVLKGGTLEAGDPIEVI